MRVGFCGLGIMGSRMAAHVVAAGHDVTVWTRTPGKAQAWAEEHGARAADTPAQAAEGADAVITMLVDGAQVAWALEGVTEPLCIDMSTIGAPAARALAEGRRFVDAPVSGSTPGAEAGTLTIMAGGEADALERVRPVLERFAAKIVHMGPSGAGHVAKLLNNFLNGVALAATSEAMVAARRAGLDLERFLDVLNSSSGVNFATLNRFPSIVRGDYLEGGLTGRLMAKDVRLYLDYVARIGVPTFTGPGCLATFEVVNAMGYGDQISNRVVDGIGDLAGGVRLQDTTTSEGASG